VKEELQKRPVSTDKKCPVEDCGKTTSENSEDRFCEYEIFNSLSSFNICFIVCAIGNFFVYSFGVMR
jgi:hypothetical protein